MVHLPVGGVVRMLRCKEPGIMNHEVGIWLRYPCGSTLPISYSLFPVNIVIMAGGGGTRLWPVSREKFPKQFTQLFGSRTLLQHTYRRALAVVRRPERIVVTTRREYVPEIRRQLPRVPRENILVEPVKRDTAPSIGMAAAFLASRGQHDLPFFMIPSDHYFQDETSYIRAMQAAGKLLAREPDRTVLLGSWPTYPETGLGYIELGRRQIREGVVSFHSAKRFCEKPSLALAKRFVASGRYVWNMGIYGWRVRTLLQLLHQCAPTIAKRVDALEEIFRAGGGPRRIERVYRTMPTISIDYAVTEHQDPASIAVAPGAYGWSDIGHWGAIQELLGGREGVELKRGVVVQVHGDGTFVYSAADRAIGLAGVKNCIVVSTPDAVLICDKHHVQDVKKLVQEFERKRYKKFL